MVGVPLEHALEAGDRVVVAPGILVEDPEVDEGVDVRRTDRKTPLVELDGLVFVAAEVRDVTETEHRGDVRRIDGERLLVGRDRGVVVRPQVVPQSHLVVVLDFLDVLAGETRQKVVGLLRLAHPAQTGERGEVERRAGGLFGELRIEFEPLREHAGLEGAVGLELTGEVVALDFGETLGGLVVATERPLERSDDEEGIVDLVGGAEFLRLFQLVRDKLPDHAPGRRVRGYLCLQFSQFPPSDFGRLKLRKSFHGQQFSH